MENLLRNAFWGSVALFVVGIVLVIAATADAIPYVLGDKVGACMAVAGVFGTSVLFSSACSEN